MDTTSAVIHDTDKSEGQNSFCVNTPFDKLDTTSARYSDIPQCESPHDFCTYSPFDNLHNTRALRNDSTPMGTEGTLRFTESNISDILQCDGADSLSDSIWEISPRAGIDCY